MTPRTTPGGGRWQGITTAPGEVTYYTTIDGVEWSVRHRHPNDLAWRCGAGSWQPSPVLTLEATMAMIEANGGAR